MVLEILSKLYIASTNTYSIRLKYCSRKLDIDYNVELIIFHTKIYGKLNCRL